MEILPVGRGLLEPLTEFFKTLDTPESKDAFSPHPFDREQAEVRCAYNGNDEYHVLVEDGTILGYGMLRGWDEGYAIPSLGIAMHPGRAGRGLGTKMMAHLLERARLRGAETVLLKVRVNNTSAIALYRKMGFRLVALNEQYLKGTIPVAPEVSILITTINEGPNLRLLLPELTKVFAEQTSYEIVVIDGASTDDTVEAARDFGCRVVFQKSKGYSEAIRNGIEAAWGKYVIVMDADNSHTPADALQLFVNRKRADIVINSRFVPGGGSEGPRQRVALSQFLNSLYRMILGLPFREISGGFRIYRREVLAAFELTSEFYEVQEELLIKPHWLGFSAIEIPYVYRSRAEGDSKAKLFKYGFHLLLALVRFRRMKGSIQRQAAATSALANANVR